MRLKPSLALLAVACVCTACATRSFTPDTPSEARQLDIRQGDEIRVVTTNRERLTFRVEQVQEDRCIGVTVEPNVKETLPPGTDVEVRYADIAMMEVCIASIGCAYRPMIKHQVAEAVRPEDASYDCSQLEAAILNIDTVRWVIRDVGGELETSGHKAARYAGNVLVIPLSLGAGAPGYMADGGHAALNAADHRILELLRLKRARGCAAAATSEPGMTDLQMLQALEPLMPANRGPDRQTLDQRTALLDHLRAPLPAPPESALPTH